jgi:hypothetical protein
LATKAQIRVLIDIDSQQKNCLFGGNDWNIKTIGGKNISHSLEKSKWFQGISWSIFGPHIQFICLFFYKNTIFESLRSQIFSSWGGHGNHFPHWQTKG